MVPGADGGRQHARPPAGTSIYPGAAPRRSVVNVAVGSDTVSSTDLQAMSSVLDRTLGRTAHVEVSMTSAQQNLDILRELDA